MAGMNRLLRLAGAAAAVTLAIAACSSGNDSSGSAAPGVDDDECSGADDQRTGRRRGHQLRRQGGGRSNGPAADSGTITIKDFAFGAPLTVRPGAMIKVTNMDSAAHDVASDDQGKFRTPLLNQGESATFTAPTAARDVQVQLHGARADAGNRHADRARLTRRGRAPRSLGAGVLRSPHGAAIAGRIGPVASDDVARRLDEVRWSTEGLLDALRERPPTDSWARQPSLLPGWTRGHVLSHLARNADAMVRTLAGTARGEQHPDVRRRGRQGGRHRGRRRAAGGRAGRRRDRDARTGWSRPGPGSTTPTGSTTR